MSPAVWLRHRSGWAATGTPTEIAVALDRTRFAYDGCEATAFSMLIGHGRATSLMWRTVQTSALIRHRRGYESALLAGSALRGANGVAKMGMQR